MFAYCNNNPINCIDMTGCYLVSVIPVNLGIIGKRLTNNITSNKMKKK